MTTLYDTTTNNHMDKGSAVVENRKFWATMEDCIPAWAAARDCGGSPELAMLMLYGVRLGGPVKLPTPWKWGFGR